VINFTFFSPEQRKKGVSIADYLPSPKSVVKSSDLEEPRLSQQESVRTLSESQTTVTEIRSNIAETRSTTNVEAPSTGAETGARIAEVRQPGRGTPPRTTAVRQRKFSFKNGKVRYVGLGRIMLFQC
jgi:hypothetical protein